MIISLLSISFIHLLAVMSPGPDVALTVRNSVLYGRRSGLFTSLGIVCGNMFLVAGAVFGISALINGIPSLRSVIMLIGGIYLIYMGLSSARTISDTTVDNFSDNSEKKSLIVLDESKKNVYLSSRNLKRVKVVNASKLNTYDILNANLVLISEDSLPQIDTIFIGEGK